MFEDSLVESTGRIRTRSRLFAVGSFALQAAVLAMLILVPILYPAALPKQALSTLLVAPPPPPASAPTRQERAAHAAPVQLTGLVAPSTIPQRVMLGNSAPPTPPGMDLNLDSHGSGQVQGALSLLGSMPPAAGVAARPKASAAIRVSAGVAAGHILVPMRPAYPAIAKETHVQGTVSIEAVISKEGLVKQAHVISGPPLLVQAALDAVSRARYVPFKLNGEPVEVDTAINIVFTLGE